jgi:hypothetical protein
VIVEPKAIERSDHKSLGRVVYVTRDVCRLAKEQKKESPHCRSCISLLIGERHTVGAHLARCCVRAMCRPLPNRPSWPNLLAVAHPGIAKSAALPLHS